MNSKKWIVSFLMVLMSSACWSQVGIDVNVLAEKIILQLESSGALERAVQKIILQIKQQDIEAQIQEEQKKLTLQMEKAKLARSVDESTDFILGEKKAALSIIIYSDFECPFCKRFHQIPLQIVADLPNQVNLVWRHLPLSFHDPMATKEAIASICAFEQSGQSGFWKLANSIMNSTVSNGQGMPAKGNEDPILNLALSLGLDKDKFQLCQGSDSVRKRIESDKEDAAKAGINGTPGVILINHKTGKLKVLEGAAPADELKAYINQLINEP